MGIDVYTPAYRRLCNSTDYLAICSRYDAWQNRPTVQTQEWTNDDSGEYGARTAIRGRMERAAGHFRQKAPFSSQIRPLADIEASGGAHSVELTHAEVTQYLAEWRTYLRMQVQQEKHLDLYVDGFGEPAMSPFDIAVQLFKAWCIVCRLGEGCYIV